MAGSSASGRAPPPDGRATGKSGLGPLEALWKHEAEKRCAIPTDRAKRSLGSGIGKYRKLRKNSRFRVIVHGSFDTTHNLKVVGSNPTPATKSINQSSSLACPGRRRQIASQRGATKHPAEQARRVPPSEGKAATR